ncbi:chemotaxis protein CheB [Methylobacter tundripaludum]|uniref:protein-glutamate O-methyltransferase n=1 Tax=Methylobacter tundripaludum (strain ATCC BAA-1195 / DSM 17260 / SV96) TaxID=697282 RepID=G3IVQ8_METTV|nr:chemotaxis protein CheB [Methylobacter tundripaludum]EGW21795.1 MCP methyltransferase/methylesterase, CheR/CheB [Methylobacter tundripaludum SV96]
MTANKTSQPTSTRKVRVKADTTPLIIGIGASAGGLEALEQLLSHVPVGNNAAFVVIQHLDPTKQGLLPELLQRITPMSVVQAGDGMKVKPNYVYVIPPNKELAILHGKLHLLDPVEPRGLRLPIDFFFKSLADDRHEQAVAVILSGMGSDGTLGLRAIKENAGLTLVQTPESAKFDAMPLSAINAGLADIIATPQELWNRIFSYLNHKPRGVHIDPEPVRELNPQSALNQIVILLRERTGNDFSLYKKSTIYRRIERRMMAHQIDTIADYANYLRKNTQELDLLFKELLIGVTTFFRDPAVWELLKTSTIPALLTKYPAGKTLRAWVTACSTGEEAYSLAIIFKEVVAQNQLQHLFKLQIFATDLDKDAIERARQGFYPEKIVADVSTERLSRFFVAENDGYRIKKEIREMVIFAQQNIFIDPPFTKLDLLSCRNLLIYFDSKLQKKLIPLFHYALTTNGILLLGNSETIGDFTSLFTTIDNPLRLYQRSDRGISPAGIDFPTKYLPAAPMTQQETAMTTPALNLQKSIDQLLLQNYTPAAVVVNANGDILYINGRTGKYLEPPAGKINWNIHAMARDGLRHEIAGALKKAQHQSEAIYLPGLTIATDSGTQTINLTVQALTKPEALVDMLIVIFTDVATPPTRKRSRKSPSAEQQLLLAELQQAHEELQTFHEERQSSQEELTSSTEELQSTNEELQSTNEELTTSKEEMQSMNEELHTINAELQSKVTDLSWVNNDMNNLINSMEIATVFLDNALKIRRFTSHAVDLFKLIPSDVGRPLSDIAANLDYPGLHQDVAGVLKTLVFSEKQVKRHDGSWFKVRIMPYRTQDNVIDGVVITFIDISATKKLEIQLRSTQA